MGKRGPKPKGRVNTSWRPELAYAIGLIAADGSLSKNGRHINFTSKDLDLIHTFQKCLGLEDIKIGVKNSGYGSDKVYHQVQFGDVLLYDFLVSLGLHSSKAHTLQAVNIPDKYFFDFVRGEWDGDGTIYRSCDKRWKNSYITSIGFTAASKSYLQWLQSNINSKIVTTGFITKVNRSYQLRYASSDTRKLFQSMFYRNDLPYLERKFAKAQKIFRITGL